MKKVYQCYIKSHCEAPDYEVDLEAESYEEALERFSRMTHWEKEDLRPHVLCMTEVEK